MKKPLKTDSMLKKLATIVFLMFLLFLTAPTTILAEDNGSRPTPEAQSLGEVEMGSNGQLNFSPDVLEKLNQALAERQATPERKWDPYIRIGIDVAIGVGAALVTFAVIKLVQVRKSKVKGQKSKDAEQKTKL